MENKVITVTSPLLPSLDDFIPYLQDIWNRKWLTNNGHYHQELEKALCEYLKVPYIDRKSTRLNSSHGSESRMPSSA